MKAKTLIICFLWSITIFSSCSKNNLNCFSDPGEVVSERRELDSAFCCISLYDNVNVELVSSNVAFVEVFAGENMISGITTEVINNELVIHNTNECNLIKQSDRLVKAIIYYTQLDSIQYRSNGDLTALGMIKCDTFKLEIFEGSGSIDLKLDCEKSYLNYHFGTADLTVSGQSKVNYIYQVSYGPIQALDLATGFTYLETRSPNNCYVNASNTLEATIIGNGNVYYTGNAIASRDGLGLGELIRYTGQK